MTLRQRRRWAWSRPSRGSRRSNRAPRRWRTFSEAWAARWWRNCGSGLRGRASAWGVWWWRQQPPTARGMVFLALEDAKGLVNVALYPAVAAASREALTAPFVIVEGQVQYDGQSVGVLGTRVLPVGYPQYGRMED